MNMIKKIILYLSMIYLSACNTNQPKNQYHNPTDTDTDTLKVITPDWGIAAELTAMGHPPIATGDIRIYGQWSGNTLPKQVHDLGVRYLPNPEMMTQLNADLIIDNFFYAHLRPMYGDTPFKSVLLKSAATNKASKKETRETTTDIKNKEKIATWEDFTTATRKLGKIINQSEDAEHFIESSEQNLITAGEKFRRQHSNIRRLAIVQFVDASKLQMYAKSSMYQPTLDKMGLELISFGDGNQWGFDYIELADLNKIETDTCLIIVKPFSKMLQHELNHSVLWQRLNFGDNNKNSRCLGITDSVWLFGGIASMNTISEHLLKIKLQGTYDGKTHVTNQKIKHLHVEESS